MGKVIYEKTVESDGCTSCKVTGHMHVMEVDGAYVAVAATIYRGWMGFDTRCQSFVYDNKDDAVKFCKDFMPANGGVKE